jgi:MFS family permease
MARPMAARRNLMSDNLAREEVVGRAQMITIAAAIICISVAGIGLSLTAPLISLLLSAQGVSATTIGVMTAFASFSSIVTSPFVPRLALLLGLRNFLVLSLALSTGILCLFPVLTSLTAWFILRFILGITINCLFVLSEYWINAASPDARRGLIMGIYATALSIGFAAGPGLLVLSNGATPWLFIVGAAFFAVASVPIFFAGKDAPPLEGKSGVSSWGFVLIAPIATLAAFVFGTVEQGSFAFMTLYGEALHLSVANSAWLLTLFGLGNVISQVPLGFLADKVNRPLLLLACTLVSTVGALMMPVVSSSLPALMSVAFITGGVVGGIYTVGLAHLGAHFSGGTLAAANAAFIMFYCLGMMIGTPLMGVAVDTVRPHGFAYGLASICGAYALLIAWRLRTHTS